MIKQGRSNKYGFILNYDDTDTFVGAPVLEDKYEPYESELFLSKVQGGDVIVDVGANIGYYSMLAALKLKQDYLNGRVIAFEPNLQNFDLLKKNVEANRLENVEFKNLAVGDHDGDIKLFLSKENKGDHQVYYSADREFESCKMVTLDDFFDNDEQIDILKIDTQGYDLFVLKGFEKYLKSGKKIKLFTEFWGYGNKKSGASSEEYFRVLKDNFREVFYIDEVSNTFYPVDYEFVIQKCSEYNGYNHANLYCER